MNSYDELLTRLRLIQEAISSQFGVNDILSNSKIYEVLIANSLGHALIPGHSGSRDAKAGPIEFEYKHFKELSKNHTWTFNDYSDSTIAKLNSDLVKVIFAHVDDTVYPPIFDWYYPVTGPQMSSYLATHTQTIENDRKMINVSSSQLEQRLSVRKSLVNPNESNGPYSEHLLCLFTTIAELEKQSGVTGLLTSNKIWELVVASKLNHKVNSEQGGRAGAHDAKDERGNWYEYKVGVSTSWSFQDISETVLEKYFETKAIICATVDKEAIEVNSIISISPKKLVPELRRRLKVAEASKKEIRRKQVRLGKNVLIDLGGVRLL